MTHTPVLADGRSRLKHIWVSFDTYWVSFDMQQAGLFTAHMQVSVDGVAFVKLAGIHNSHVGDMTHM